MPTPVTYYVNTASTAGGNGTTNDTTGANRAYATLSEWNTQRAGDITGAGSDEIVTVECSGSTADTTGDFDINAAAGWVTGASNTITINGDNNTGAWSTSHYRLEVTSSGNYQHGIGVFVGYVTINDIQVGMTNANNQHMAILMSDANGVVNRCIVRGVSLTAGWTWGIYCDGGGANTIRNCLVYDINSGGNDEGFRSIGSNNVFQNCTAHTCNVGFRQSSGGSPTVTNCVGDACTNGFSGTWGGDYNASDIASDAPGGNSQTGSTVWTNEGGDIFIPDITDTICKGNGDDLSGQFTTDLQGNTRTAWDIGANAAEGADSYTAMQGVIVTAS